MNIREGTPEDAAVIAQAHLASWKTTYPGIIPQEYIDGLKVEDGVSRWHARLTEKKSIILGVVGLAVIVIGVRGASAFFSTAV